MPAARPSLRHPLTLAGLLTWATVAMTLHLGQPDHLALRWGCAGLFLAAYLGTLLYPAREHLRRWLLLVEAGSALGLAMLPGSGIAPTLLVLLAAQAATTWPLRQALLWMGLVNLVLYLLLKPMHSQPLLVVLSFAGFQGFAMLTVHYAQVAEQARDRLTLAHADLLATRALHADQLRDAERLRLSRELHDVAGHKLTALRLHLRALASAPGASAELQLCQQLSAELLTDLRAVVQAMRDTGQLDIATALRALAAPLPRPRLELDIDEHVRIDNPELAHVLLRCVQEALTNSARHSQARTLHVQLSQDGSTLRLCIADDGSLRQLPRWGNGLTGMHERIVEQGGQLQVGRSASGSLQLQARFPA